MHLFAIAIQIIQLWFHLFIYFNWIDIEEDKANKSGYCFLGGIKFVNSLLEGNNKQLLFISEILYNCRLFLMPFNLNFIYQLDYW